MASEWPAWVVLYAAYDKAADSYEAFSLSDDNWPWRVSLEKESGMYLHRDAARAWQAFRDWCDGTAEQWQARAVKAYNRGLLAGTPIRFGDGR